MEAIKSFKSYWRRRSYQRLQDLPESKKLAVVRLGGSQKCCRKPWKAVAMRPAIRLKRLIARLRDAYMNGMLKLAGGGGAARKNGDGGAVWDRRIPRARQGSCRGGDFEKRIMIHLYNSVIATR